MKTDSHADPHLTPARAKLLRARRLRAEADNCIALAVGMDGERFASELIDEAARLMARVESLRREAGG